MISFHEKLNSQIHNDAMAMSYTYISRTASLSAIEPLTPFALRMKNLKSGMQRAIYTDFFLVLQDIKTMTFL